MILATAARPRPAAPAVLTYHLKPGTFLSSGTAYPVTASRTAGCPCPGSRTCTSPTNFRRTRPPATVVPLPAGGISLHAAGVGGGVQHAAAAGHGADPAERPRRPHRDVVAPAPQVPGDRLADTLLHVEGLRGGLARVERRRHVPGVERR